jgi:Domain of unknown function (DUF4136)
MLLTAIGRRYMTRAIVGAILCASLASVSAAQTPTYGVRVTVSKNVDPAKFKTYSWTKGGPSPVKSVDAQIVAAVDKELKGLGLTMSASGPGDVLVTYYTLRRTDVDLKGKQDAAGTLPQYPVGSLLVAMLDPGTRRRLVQLRTDKPIDLDPAKAESTINAAVAELFAKYPTRQK